MDHHGGPCYRPPMSKNAIQGAALLVTLSGAPLSPGPVPGEGTGSTAPVSIRPERPSNDGALRTLYLILGVSTAAAMAGALLIMKDTSDDE